MYKALFVGTALILAAANSTPAWAGWGCAARATDGAVGRVWAADTEASARTDALKYCEDGGHAGCHIIGCNENVDTQARAHALWPSSGAVTKCYNATASNPCKQGISD
jgi:hypothetical protein